MHRVVIAGGGLSGLAIAHRLAGANYRLAEASPRPGGGLRTERLAGFVHECGAELLYDDGSRLDGLLDELALPGEIVEPAASAGLEDLASLLGVDPATRRSPIGLRGGAEQLVAALRAPLGDRLYTGRAVVALTRHDDGSWSVTLDGEHPTVWRSERVLLALPPARSAELLAALLPEHAAVLRERAARTQRTITSVHLGYRSADLGPAARGIGFARAEVRPYGCAGIACTSNLFPRRNATGRALFRVLFPEGATNLPDDTTLRDAATLVLEATLAVRASLLFWRVTHSVVATATNDAPPYASERGLTWRTGAGDALACVRAAHAWVAANTG